MKVDLTDKVIAITGASSGIGAATALACANAGMHVVLAARRKNRLRRVARRIELLGRATLTVVCDVRHDDQVDSLFSQAANRFGRLDSVFANAGYGLFASVAATPESLIRDIFETNFFGTVRCVRTAADYMGKNGGGHVLVCSSAASKIGLPMYGFYAATKAAQDSIVGAMRAEMKGRNIYFSSIHPIGTRTEFLDVVRKTSSATNPHNLTLNTPTWLMHSAEKVANSVVACLRRPRPEVWPSRAIRYALALTTGCPKLSAWAMQRLLQRQYGKTDRHHK